MSASSSADRRQADRVLLGRITAAHGLKGEVKIAAFTAEPLDIAAYGKLLDESGGRAFEILSLRPANGRAVIAKLKTVNDRTAAERLRGTDLYVERSLLPQLEDTDEFYHSDLIGLRAVDANGDIIGEVVAVQNFGAGDLLEIRHADTPRTELVPFESAFVPVIDLTEGFVTVVRPVYDIEQA